MYFFNFQKTAKELDLLPSFPLKILSLVAIMPHCQKREPIEEYRWNAFEGHEQSNWPIWNCAKATLISLYLCILLFIFEKLSWTESSQTEN